jgi:hypothetical protein
MNPRACGWNNGWGQPVLCTTMEHTQITVTRRQRFLRAAETEMMKFERQEPEFRKRDRKSAQRSFTYRFETSSSLSIRSERISESGVF